MATQACCTRAGVAVFDDVITVFCRFGAPKLEAFSPFIISGVHFESGLSQSAAQPRAASGDSAAAIIPFLAAQGYVSPAAWALLDADERAAHWTLRKGDLMALGEVDLASESASSLLSRGGAFVITSVAEKNTKTHMAHFEVHAGHSYSKGVSI